MVEEGVSEVGNNMPKDFMILFGERYTKIGNPITITEKDVINNYFQDSDLRDLDLLVQMGFIKISNLKKEQKTFLHPTSHRLEYKEVVVEVTLSLTSKGIKTAKAGFPGFIPNQRPTHDRIKVLERIYSNYKKNANYVLHRNYKSWLEDGYCKDIPLSDDFLRAIDYLKSADYLDPAMGMNEYKISSKGIEEAEKGCSDLRFKAAPRAISKDTVDKYSAEVSAQKIKSRIDQLSSQGTPIPLKRQYAMEGFGGTRWSKWESNAIDFEAGFEYLVRCRAIQFIDDEQFETTEFFQHMTKKFDEPPPFPFQLKKQIVTEADNMHLSYHWLYIFENTLRSFVYDALIEHYEDKWYDKLSNPVKQKIKQNKARWQSGLKPRNELEFTELPNLSNIIKKEWTTLFGNNFKNIDQAELDQSLKKIEKFRNSIAHCRMFTEDEFREFYSEIQRIIKAISE